MGTGLNNTAIDFNSSLADLERILYQKAMEWARDTYRRILECVDDHIKKARDKSLAIIRQDKVWITTKPGAVNVKRRYYRDRDATYHYLLDELLGIGKYHHITRHVQKLALDMAGVMPFRRSAEIPAKAIPLNLSHQTIHRIVARVADIHLEKQDSLLEWFQRNGELPDSKNLVSERMVVEADGIMLSLQREKTGKTEAKLGIAYEGRKKSGNNRFITVNKSVYADVISGDSFWPAMTLKLSRRYDLSGTNYMLLGGDGASWIREGAEYFGADYRLCRFHLNRNLSRALGHDRDTLKAIKEALHQENLPALFTLLDKAGGLATGDVRKDIVKLSGYLKSNFSGLKTHPEMDNAGLNTGVIEGNIDKFIARRMKNQGMSRSIQGIRRMLWLRIALYDNKLNDYLYTETDKPESYKLPPKSIRRIIDKHLEQDYTQYFKARVPALTGPHASRPWAEYLKSITRDTMI